MERLHKYLAHCGVASRRKAEEMIAEGRVKVNNETITEFGVKVDPAKDVIKVDGKSIRQEEKVYYLLHKPRGYVTTASDQYGRRTVLDLIPDVRERIYPVGRLDRDSEGLIVLTNDGDLSYYLTHPGCGVKKLYRVSVEGVVEQKTLDELVEKGIKLGPVFIQPIEAKVQKTYKEKTIVEITVGEGINREIRRLFAALGHEVKRLVRLRVGPLAIKGIGRGKYRRLRRKELEVLQEGMASADISGVQAMFPSGSAEERKPKGKRGRRVYGERGKRLGKPDPSTNSQFKKKAKRKEAGEDGAKKDFPKKAASKKKSSPKSKNISHPLG